MKKLLILFILILFSCKEQYDKQNIRNKKALTDSSEVPKNNFDKWQGVYSGNFEITRANGDFKINYTIEIAGKEKVSVTEKINDEINKVPETFIELFSDDKLVIKSKTDHTLEYIISQINQQYYLMGNTVYMLNPPNDKYILKKKQMD